MKPDSPISVLLLAADSGEGGLGAEMIDPALRTKFAAEGVSFQAAYVSDLKREQLDLFHVVVLLRSPVPGHPIDDLDDFRAKAAWLREFVARGGGLLVMFTECYGKTETPLNEFCEPWGIRFFFNRLEGDSRTAAQRFPRLVESAILPFHFVENPCLKLPAGTLALVTEGGHGAQHLTCVCEGRDGIRWHPILRGGPSITSKSYSPFYINSSDADIPDPVVCAAAEVGDGRVVAFPGSAPFWIVNSHIWRFQGYLQEQDRGRGFAFFREAFRWLAGSERNARLPADVVQRAGQAVDKRLLVKARHFSFRAVEESEQERLQRCTSQKVWFGPGAYDRQAVSSLAGRLRAAGYRAAFPLGDYRDLNDRNWPEVLRLGREASSDSMLVVPGYELLDDEGVRSAVVSPEQLPRHMLKYPNSTLLEAVWISIFGCVSVLRDPLANRIPPQRYGGYNLIEWDASAEWFDLYKKLVASKYFVGPLAFHRANAQGPLDTWVLVPEGQTAFDMLRRSRHGSYISDGPLLERFTFLGPDLMDDEWEGYWYGYRPGEEVRFSLAVSSQAKLKEVVLYDGEEVFARFSPAERSFSREFRFPAWRDYGLHLTAEDEAGGRIHATFPAYTRNLQFWGHVGSDSMNNYVNPMLPHMNGYQGVGRELYDPFGFVTLGAGWGDYLRVTPALPYSEFMPRQEISGILGSFNVHHPSPILQVGGRKYYLNDHRRVFPFCGADAQAFRGEIVGEHIDNDEGLAQVWHGKPVVPTRIFLPVPGVRAEDEYVVWRWRPKEQIYVEVRKTVTLAGGALEEDWVTFASNSHYLLPDLRVRAIRDSSRCIRVAALPEQKSLVSPNKEWDNSHYLRAAGGLTPNVLELEPGDGLEIGNGGVGTFGFVPLGEERRHRCLLFRGDKELTVFFQCRLSEAERTGGRFVLEYLIALDAGETEESPFAALPGGRSFSRLLDMRGRDYPAEIDLDSLFPDLRGRTIHLRLAGLPGGTVRWQAEDGRTVLASQAQQGRSYHIIASDMPRRYRLEQEDTLR